MEKEKAQTSRAALGSAPVKITTISAQTGLSIQNWLKENYFNAFTIDDVNRKFDVSLTDDDIFKIYKGNFRVNYPKFSYCKAPIKNTIPSKEIDLLQLFKAITGTHYKQITETYRSMEPGEVKGEFKKTYFDYVIFGGTFTERKITAIKNASGYACFDFDHVPAPDTLKNLLINDSLLDAQMCFTSPSGDGLKLILCNNDHLLYDRFYSLVTNYLKNKYPAFASSIDGKTKDIARACFICYDPNCYIKPQYLELCQANKN